MLQHHNKLLMKLIRSRTGLYIGSVVALIIASLFAFLVPFIGKVVIDRIIPEAGPNAIDQALIEKDIVQRIIDRIGGAPYLQDNLWIAAMAIILVTLLSGLFMYAKDYFSAKACESTVEELRNNLFRHIHLLPARFHTQADSGDLLQRCTSDIDTLHEFLTTQVMNIGRTIILMLKIGRANV